jgi:hypothetical protein
VVQQVRQVRVLKVAMQVRLLRRLLVLLVAVVLVPLPLIQRTTKRVLAVQVAQQALVVHQLLMPAVAVQALM